jgi:hypothetical protein
MEESPDQAPTLPWATEPFAGQAPTLGEATVSLLRQARTLRRATVSLPEQAPTLRIVTKSFRPQAPTVRRGGVLFQNGTVRAWWANGDVRTARVEVWSGNGAVPGERSHRSSPGVFGGLPGRKLPNCSAWAPRGRRRARASAADGVPRRAVGTAPPARVQPSKGRGLLRMAHVDAEGGWRPAVGLAPGPAWQRSRRGGAALSSGGEDVHARFAPRGRWRRAGSRSPRTALGRAGARRSGSGG